MRLRPTLIAAAALLLPFLGGCRGTPSGKPLVELSIKSIAKSEHVPVPEQPGVYSMPADGNVFLRTELDVHYLRCEGAGEIPADDEAAAMKIPELGTTLALYYSHLATLRTADGKTFRGQGGTDAQTGKPCVHCSALRMSPCGPEGKETVHAFFEVSKDALLDGATITYRDGSAPVPAI